MSYMKSYINRLTDKHSILLNDTLKRKLVLNIDGYMMNIKENGTI